MIKGRKIETHNVNVVLPVRQNIKSTESLKITLQSSLQNTPLEFDKQENVYDVRNNSNKNESQNYQNISNKDKQVKKHQNESVKIIYKAHNVKEKIAYECKPQSQHHRIDANNQTIHDKKANKIAKPQTKNTQNKKQKIQQVIKHQEQIRKGLKKPALRPLQNNQQIPVHDKQPQQTGNVIRIELNQQKQQQQWDVDVQEMQRQTLPNPIIEEQSVKPQNIDLDADCLDIYLDYQQNSSFEEAFSFLPSTEPIKQDTMANLPINMELFELSADQLLALDYFQV